MQDLLQQVSEGFSQAERKSNNPIHKFTWEDLIIHNYGMFKVY